MEVEFRCGSCAHVWKQKRVAALVCPKCASNVVSRLVPVSAPSDLLLEG